MGILDSLVAKIQDLRKRAADKKQLTRLLVHATADGNLTEIEMRVLTDRMRRSGLTTEDIKRARIEAYMQAYKAAKADRRITAEEEQQLANVKHFLKISDDEIGKTKAEFHKLRIITEIEQGNLPSIELSDIALKKGEVVHWEERGELIENRVVSRRYEGGSRGVSIRLMKGVSYRVGSHRGHLVSEKADVVVSVGELVITSQRVIFRGDNKSFNLLLRKIVDFDLFSNGIRVTGETGKPRLVRFSRAENADVIGALMARLLNQ